MHPCVFCDIISGKSPGEILHEDEDTIVLRDINPVNKYHFLAISKEHIYSEGQLLPENKELVEKMIQNGNKVMAQMGADMDDIICGFHRFPFLTVNHLHLHFVSPSTDFYFDEDAYGLDPEIYISAEDVLARLEQEVTGKVATSAVVEEIGQQINYWDIFKDK